MDAIDFLVFLATILMVQTVTTVVSMITDLILVLGALRLTSNET